MKFDKIKEIVLLEEEIIYNNSRVNLIKIIKENNDEFRLKWFDTNNFKFYSKFSLGTLYIQGFPKIIEGIKGFGEIDEIDEIDEKSTKITLNTKFRIELYLMIFLFLIILIAQALSDSQIPKLTIILFPIILFWLIIRIQEKILFKKLKKYISKKNAQQHRLSANSGYSNEKQYFRDQETTNKADKNVSLLHATCLNQDRWQQFKQLIVKIQHFGILTFLKLNYNLKFDQTNRF